MARSIFCSSLSSPSSVSGSLLYFLSVGVALLGYSLAEGNMARWALTVVASVVLSLPSGETLFPVVVGDYSITNKILPRIYTLHFLMGLICPLFVMWHAVEVHHSDFSTDLTTASGKSGKEFLCGGMVKDSLMTGLFGLSFMQGFNETSYLWGLIEDVNANDWPQESKTPEPIGPEWYVLPLFAGLKMTSIYGLLFIMVSTILAYLKRKTGSTLQVTYSLSIASLCLLGLLALEAHESLTETYMIAFILIWINTMLFLGHYFQNFCEEFKQEFFLQIRDILLPFVIREEDFKSCHISAPME